MEGATHFFSQELNPAREVQNARRLFDEALTEISVELSVLGEEAR